MKKFLSLVLALVMTMSLVTVSAGAKDFTDDSKINYKEAVDVMSAVGVIDGYTDGSFNPTASLTRGAAAKIICNLILGPTTADALVADAAPYSDVPTSNVFAGYIAYCAKEGIISGYADGTFRPANTLTGYAFMKMLLGALGYESETEGYTGNNWSINVAKRALNIGLDDDLVGEFNGTKAVTREEACLYAFNTLTATMVEYENNNSVTVNGVTFTNKSSAKDMVWTGVEKMYDGKKDGKVQFCEKYFTDLTLVDDSNDLGQPVNKWKNKSTEIGKYSKSADKVVAVKDGDKTLKDVLTSSSYMDYSTKDLDYKADADNKNKVAVYLNGEPYASDTAANAAELKKGDVVYAYENDDGDVETVVIARYQYAKIDDVATNMSSTEKDNGAKYRVKLVDINDNNVGTYYDSYDDSAKNELVGFDADTYKEDTALAIAKNGNKIVDSYVIEGVSGKPTSAKDGASGNITIDGTKYVYAGLIAGSYNNVDFDKEYTVYATKEGYALAVDGTGASNVTDIYYVTGIYTATEGGETVYYAQRVSSEGKVETVQVEKGAVQAVYGSAAPSVTDKITDGAKAGLYTFSDKKVDATSGYDKQKAGDGILTIKAFAKDDDIKADFSQFPGTLSSTIKATDSTLKTSKGNFYVNEETIYVAVENVGSKIDVTNAVGGMKVTYASGINTFVVTDEDDAKTARLVFFAADSLSASASTENVVYLADKANQKNSSDTRVTDDLWFMNDLSNPAGTVITDDITTQGFYTYSMSGDNYKLEDGTALTLKTDYDDEDGYMEGLQVTGVYNKSGKSYVTFADAHNYLSDIKFNGVTIIDTRDDDAIDASVYDTEITTVADLKDAVKAAGTVTVDVYFDNGVKFIAVTGVAAAGVDGISIVETENTTTDGEYAIVVTCKLDDETVKASALYKLTAGVDEVYFTVAGTKYVVAEGSTTTIADILKADGFCGFFTLNDEDGNLIEYVKFAD